jgi:hypothetical protein
VLAVWQDSAADLVVDDGQQSQKETHRPHYNWEQLAAIDFAASPPRSVFNSGQWFGAAGALKRQDFDKVMDWSVTPPKSRHQSYIKNGDQGVLNGGGNQERFSAA